jgi:lipopolysaccharide export system protein LptC
MSGRGDERVFRAAVRHSRLVRQLRIAIPLGLLLAVVAAVAVANLVKPLRVLANLPVDMGSVVISGSKVKMQQPRIAGFTRDNRAYELVAQAAAQDLTKPDEVELQGIQARMEMQDKSVVNTTARSGLFDTKTEKLRLRHNILVLSSSGLKARLDEAEIEVRIGRMVSEKPVEVATPTLVINSNRMEITDSGDVMVFDRGVTVTLLPRDEIALRTVSQAGKP